MKILIISWYFPPVNTIGAIRVGKFARFLAERGHEIGVVAGKAWGHPETLSLGARLYRTAYAKSFDVNALPQRIRTGLQGLSRQTSDGVASRDGQSLVQRIGQFYQHATNVPDKRIGWLPYAYARAREMCRDWLPDLVFASGPPFTALVAARLISRTINRPWVAELRDRWADDPYEVVPRWRSRLDQWVERRVLSSAIGLVTVSEPWAEFYRSKYGKPVATIYNGYDPIDFEVVDETPHHSVSGHFVIGYTGSIYPGKRDPTPLFEALQRMGAGADKFRVIFVGTDPTHVLPLADNAGVRHLVEIRPEIPYAQALEFQRAADVLLLMQWNDLREQGSCPGKLFEYIASLRPILVLGLENGVPATIVRERGAGFCINDASLIAAQLRKWLQEKETFGRVSQLPLSARDGLSRNVQFNRLEEFLIEMQQVTRSSSIPAHYQPPGLTRGPVRDEQNAPRRHGSVKL